MMHMAGNPLGRFARYAPLAIAALFLSGCTMPDVCYRGGVSSGFELLWSSWQGLIATGVLIIFLVSALAYMLATVANHPGVRMWAVNQMYEGIATLVLAIFFIGLISWVCGLDARIFGSEVTCVPSPLPSDITDVTAGSCNAFDVASYYLQGFRNKIVTGFTSLFSLNMVLAGLASFSYTAGTAGIQTQLSFGHGLTQVSQQMGMGLSAVAMAMLLVMAQIMLLKISEYLFGYLMVAGLILRSFGATRGFGGSLIAIALGFYLIYPLAIVLLYGLILGYVNNDVNALLGVAQGAGRTYGNWWELFKNISMAFEDLWAAISGGFLAPFNAIVSFIATLAVGTLLIPFIIFIIVISFVKGLSAALGEEVDVSNLTRLI